MFHLIAQIGAGGNMGQAILLILFFYFVAGILLILTVVWIASFFFRKVSLRELFLFMTYVAFLSFCVSFLSRGPKVTLEN